MAKKQLNTLLLDAGLVRPEQLEEAKKVQERTGLPLGRALVYLGYISQKDLVKMIAAQLGLEFADLTEVKPQKEAIDLVPEDLARKHLVLPLALENGKLKLALSNPGDKEAISEIKSLTGLEIEKAVALKDEIKEALDQNYVAVTPDDLTAIIKEVEREVALKKLTQTYEHIPEVDLSSYKIDPNVLMLVSEEKARKNCLIPLGFEGNRLVVAMADPQDIFLLDNLRMSTGYNIKPVRASEESINNVISQYYKMTEVAEVEEDLEEILSEAESSAEVKKIEEVIEDAPIIKLVNMIITRGVRERASDIHVEPQEKDLRIRYRIDGVLQEVMRSPKTIQAGLLSRFKVMAGLDIAEKRKPQDGHCSLTVGGKVYDFRVATLPTIYGERIVLRILAKESVLFDLDRLGFLPDSLEKFEAAYTRPYGAILITGPTGSGKSTTLYATLNVLNKPEKNIVTIEDPVEYRLPGINQVQVNPKIGFNFARGLRAILRTSPDIVMVGEMRDLETAETGIEAALTGHLVFSTLHTNDAPSAITRLIEMGIEPFLVASAIDCVQAQRLARRLCADCKEPYQPSRQALEEVDFPLEEGEDAPELYRARGCPKCSGTGYRGRIGVYEVMPVSETIERLTVENATAEQIKKIAIEEGMRTLRQDGFEKVRMGLTSIEEVLRVVV
jgi:type IV pilus assembly protein PilB